ncbi:calcium-binding protein [Microvirga sp. Mcv34]|uniref:calcium-binding protein n=1 Tax=Microvirga sp. Mcv34 TaxID=2926016 RepID=UPI0021C6E506|nr:calcium-binding protein [Microvirga sp. Mcv34]
MAVVTPKIWSPMDAVTLDGNADRDSLTMLPNGGYVVTWRENQKIAFQLYDGTGAKVGGKSFVEGSSIGQQFSDVLSYAEDGAFVVTWTEGAESGTGRTLRMQKFNFDGSPMNGGASTIALNALSDGAQITASGNHGWAIAYTARAGASNDIRLSVFDSNGTEIRTVAPIVVGSASRPDVTWLGGTKYLVSYLLTAKRTFVIVDGESVGTPVVTGDDSIETKVVALKGADGQPSGDFVVVHDTDIGTGTISAERYRIAADGTLTSLGTTSISTGGQPSTGDKLSITALKGGGYAVAYVAPGSATLHDVWVKVVDANGQAGPAINLTAQAGEQITPSIFEMADGRLAVSWHDRSYPTYGIGGIVTKIVDARADKVSVTGTSKNDIYAPSEHAGDILDGSDGIDTLTFQAAGNGVGVNLGEERGTAGIAEGDTYKNFENIIGSHFADTLVGNAAANVFQSGDGDDYLDGGAGADVLIGGAGNDTYVLDNSADSIQESGAADGGIDLVYTYVSHALEAFVENMTALGSDAITLTGNDLNNTLIGNEANNTLVGGGGNDILRGAGGDDSLDGGDGNDVLDGGTGADVIAGGAGNDNLSGGDGNDNLNGGDGDDVINGGAGADVMNGGAGNDVYYIDDANDQIVDGAGVDTVYLAVSYDIARLGAIENITGVGAVDITLTGNDGNNTFTGNDGANILYGGKGHDILDGGAGNDRIHGGLGNDVLTGGSGRDIFVFDTPVTKKTEKANLDRITDFNVADDSIYLENKYFKVTPGGTLTKPKQMASKHFYKGAKAHDKDDRIIYDSKKGVLYYDADGNGSAAQVKIATLSKSLKMTHKDFFVI